MTHKERALAEMARVARPGGRVIVLEFSRPWKPLAGRLRRLLVRRPPALGKYVARDEAAYRYLAESIRMHPGPGDAQGDDGGRGPREGRVLQPRRRRGRAASRMEGVSALLPHPADARAEPRAALGAARAGAPAQARGPHGRVPRGPGARSPSPCRPRAKSSPRCPRPRATSRCASRPSCCRGSPPHEEAAFREVEMQGDAELAQEISFLARHLTWDVEEDLSRVVGDIAAHRVVGGRAGRSRGFGRAGGAAHRAGRRRVLDRGIAPHRLAREGRGLRARRGASCATRSSASSKRLDRM